VSKLSLKTIHKEERSEHRDQYIPNRVGYTRGVCVGSIVSMNKNGQIKVDFPTNLCPPLPARSIIKLAITDKDKNILLAFENNDPQLPVIIGIIQEQPIITDTRQSLRLSRKDYENITVDGEHITFDAQQEVILRCGQGSIKLRKDGTITIKGTNIVSRAKASNKIRGAAVNIN
jgi:hypothetical protein